MFLWYRYPIWHILEMKTKKEIMKHEVSNRSTDKWVTFIR